MKKNMIGEMLVKYFESEKESDSFLTMGIDSIVDPLVDSYFEKPENKGKIGEYFLRDELRYIIKKGKKGKILKNIIVDKENGETSEIDVIFITQKGIFVIEYKNYSGSIYGNEKDLYWTEFFSKERKYRFYNPVKQNENHIKWLKRYLKEKTVFSDEKIRLFNIVVFSDKSKLQNITLVSDAEVVKKSDREFCIEKIWNENEDCFEQEETEMIYKKLGSLTVKDKDEKNKHIERIREEYGSKDDKSSKNKRKIPVDYSDKYK